MSDASNDLVSILQRTPNDPSIAERVSALEQSHPADLSHDSALLEGVWDLRWSSSSQPWLRQAPWLENLQVLDPAQKRGCNLLRLRGPFGAIGAISVQADLEVINEKRVEVRFRKGGWLGPSLPGIGQLKLLREVEQSFPAWLDITYLGQQLRVCRSSADAECCIRSQKLSSQPRMWRKATSPWHPSSSTSITSSVQARL